MFATVVNEYFNNYSVMIMTHDAVQQRHQRVQKVADALTSAGAVPRFTAARVK